MAESSNEKPAPFLSEAEAEKYTMSICIYVDGLAFFIRSFETGDLLHSERLFFNKKKGHSLESRLSELIYNHPLLTFPYRDVTITYREDYFILTPPGIVIEGKEELWVSSTLMLQGENSSPIATYPINEYGVHMVTCWSQEAYSFLKRTYPYRTIEAAAVSQLKEAISTSRKEPRAQLFVFIENKRINVIACYKGEILLANKFQLFPTLSHQVIADQILFYIGSVLSALSHTPHTVEESIIILHYSEQIPQEETKKIGLALAESIPPLDLEYKWGVSF